jgi:hypothetical protein
MTIDGQPERWILRRTTFRTTDLPCEILRVTSRVAHNDATSDFILRI